MDERTSDPKRIFGYPCVSSQTSAQLSLALTLRLLSVVFGIWLWRLAQNSALHVAQDQTSALTQTVGFALASSSRLLSPGLSSNGGPNSGLPPTWHWCGIYLWNLAFGIDCGVSSP